MRCAPRCCRCCATPSVSSAPDGILIVDKPPGMTSHDVVATVRRRLPKKTKVGHTGTLYPFATGVLPVVIGKATRLSQFLTAGRKRYLASVTFGAATDTGDCMGAVVATATPAALSALDEKAVRDALAGFRGTHAQLPPAHSAKRWTASGVRAREAWRGGGARTCRGHRACSVAGARDAAAQTALLDLDVSAGYDVRSLARDLGVRLGGPRT